MLSDTLSGMLTHPALTIAFRVFSSILVIYTILLHLGTGSSNTNGWKPRIWTLRRPERNDVLFHKHSLAMMPAAITAAASLPMLLEGVLHMPSLPVVGMLFVSCQASSSLLLLTYLASSICRRVPCSVCMSFFSSEKTSMGDNPYHGNICSCPL
jgi:hypothetical protein